MELANKTIGEFALEMPHAIATLEKWKIDYCCHGKQSVTDACKDAGVTVEELMDAVGSGPTSASADWQAMPLRVLIRHILETHHVYTRMAIETVRALSEKVANRHGAHHPEVMKVRDLAFALTDELGPHLMKEEQILFPYVEELELAANGMGPAPQGCFPTVQSPIYVMMMEHESAGEVLAELRKVTNEYALPADACLSFRALYEQMMQFEADLHQHIHLENNVLFPRAIKLEQTVQNGVAAGEANERCCAH